MHSSLSFFLLLLTALLLFQWGLTATQPEADLRLRFPPGTSLFSLSLSFLLALNDREGQEETW